MSGSVYSDSDSDSDGFEAGSCDGGSCGRGAGGCGTCARSTSSALPFDTTAIQDIILKLSDTFDLRVNMSAQQVTKAVVVTSGLALAGSLIGKSLIAGKMGAAIGGAVGGACGVGFTLVSLRDIWEEVWWQLSDLFDITYDYLGGMGFKDYEAAARLLLQDKDKSANLAKMIAEVASSQLGKQVVSSILTRTLQNSA